MRYVANEYDGVLTVIRFNDNIDGLTLIEKGFSDAIKDVLTKEPWESSITVSKVINLYPYGEKLKSLAEQNGFVAIGVWERGKEPNEDNPTYLAFAGFKCYDTREALIDTVVEDIDNTLRSEGMSAAV